MAIQSAYLKFCNNITEQILLQCRIAAELRAAEIHATIPLV
jgi:hypothetical protein